MFMLLAVKFVLYLFWLCFSILYYSFIFVLSSLTWFPLSVHFLLVFQVIEDCGCLAKLISDHTSYPPSVWDFLCLYPKSNFFKELPILLNSFFFSHVSHENLPFSSQGLFGVFLYWVHWLQINLSSYSSSKNNYYITVALNQVTFTLIFPTILLLGCLAQSLLASCCWSTWLWQALTAAVDYIQGVVKCCSLYPETDIAHCFVKCKWRCSPKHSQGNTCIF